jgi:hypothetical protein
MRIASQALHEALGEARVKLAIQQSRMARLYNPMLESRITALGARLMSAVARMGLEGEAAGAADDTAAVSDQQAAV